MIIGCWLLAVSCADDRSTRQKGNEGGPVAFDVEAPQEWQPINVSIEDSGKFAIKKMDTAATRGIQKTAMEGNFAVLAYEYDKNAVNWGTSDVAVSYQDIATTSDNSTWTFSNVHYWPTTGNVLRYVGYSPVNSSCIKAVTSVGGSGLPTLTWEVSTTVAEQEDLMTAVSTESLPTDNYRKISMPFRHTLTCVKFAIGDNFHSNAVIKSIEILGVAQKGTVCIGADGYTWDVDNTSRNNFMMDGIGFSTIGKSMYDVIAPTTDNGETTMFMIPQTFDGNQRIRVVYHDNRQNTDIPVEVALTNDHEWLPGTTVTYLLSTNVTSTEYILTTTPVVVGHNGGKVNFGIVSYAADPATGDYDHDIAWRITGYSLDGGKTFSTEKPTVCNWFGIETTSGTGGSTAQKGVVTILPQSSTSTETLSRDEESNSYAQKRLTNVLKGDNTMRGGSTNYYDLSTHDLAGNTTVRNTANCYIVNRPGFYKIPLIYGNAIKDGAPNSIAWTGTPRIGHNGVGTINSPYIWDNGVPKDAVLCWQDAENLVTVDEDNCIEYNTQENMYYLKFRITTGNIKPGNAIIAVRNSGSTIMWSWHIWATPEDVFATKTVTDFQGFKHDFMPIALGWIPMNGEMKKYTERSVIVRVQQESGLVNTFRITQLAGAELTDATYGYAPYYQFGRKDPQLPCNGSASIDHDQFPKPVDDNPYHWRIVASQTTYANSIQNPHVFYAGATDWCNTRYYNLWCTDGIRGFNNTLVTKTIYDPCPAGFKMMESNACTGFSLTGGEVTNTAYMNYKKNDRGMYVWTNTAHTETLYFPNLTCRERNNGIIRTSNNAQVSYECWAWSARGTSTTTGDYPTMGCSAGIRETRIAPNCNYYRAWGFTIHPVRDN